MADFKEFSTEKSHLGTLTFRHYTFRKTEAILAVALILATIACVLLTVFLSVKMSGDGKSKGSFQNGESSPHTSALVCAQNAVCLTAPCLKTASFMAGNINRSVNPCNNFYKYACGRWSRHHPIEPDESERTVLHNIYYENELKLRRILESPVKNKADYSTEKKLKHYFKACIDTYNKERTSGNAFVNKIVEPLGGWWVLGTFKLDTFNFQNYIQKVHVDLWTNAFFTFSLSTDWHDPLNRVLEVDMSGLGMDWWYYVIDDLNQIVEAYKIFIRRVGGLMIRDSNVTLSLEERSSRLDTFVQDVYQFEKGLANVTYWTLPSENPHDHDQRVTIEELNTISKMLGFNWVDFFLYMFPNNPRIHRNTRIILYEKEYLRKMATYVQSIPVQNRTRILHNYMMWRLMQRYAQDLSWEYVHANREFYVARTGRTQNFLGTWLYCFNHMKWNLGAGLGWLFIRDHFADKSRKEVESLSRNIRTSFMKRLDLATWMDKATKQKATDKLKHTIFKMGYPDKMTAENEHEVHILYEKLVVTEDDYFQNVMNIAKYYKSWWNKWIQLDNDKSVWYYHTFDIAAYFYNEWNELTVPAGLMQFPLYSANLPKFWQYGALGSIVGHELVHAIDDYGSWFDSTGRIGEKQWWSNSTTYGYEDKKACVIDQYRNKTMGPYRIKIAKRVVEKTVPVMPRSYVNYAVSETGGVRQAYYAYKSSVKTAEDKQLAPGLNLTNDQSFFVAYAQANCYVRLDDYGYYLARTGTVSEDVRVNGALSQIKEFSQVFNCPDESNMNDQTKCEVFP